MVSFSALPTNGVLGLTALLYGSGELDYFCITAVIAVALSWVREHQRNAALRAMVVKRRPLLVDHLAMRGVPRHNVL
jgi:hypothetical protein